MSESVPKKFLFDREFTADATVKAKSGQTEDDVFAGAEEALAKAMAEENDEEATVEEPEEPPAPTFSEQDLAEAREAGRREGRDEATRDLASALESRVAETLDAINAQATNLFEAYAQDKEEHSRDAVSVATVIVRKMFPALNMDKTMAEIEHMIVEAMKRTSGSPRLIIRVTPEMESEVEAKAKELAALRGHQGAIKVIGDEDLGEGAAHVEWDGGGMIRDPAAMWAEVDEIIERNLGARAGEHAAQAEKAALEAATAAAESEAASLAEHLANEPASQDGGQDGGQEASQEVVNGAPVGDNEELAVESAPDAEVAAETAPELSDETTPQAPEQAAPEQAAPEQPAPEPEDDTEQDG